MVQWLKNVPSNAEDTGSIPGQGTKMACPMAWHAATKPSCLNNRRKDPAAATAKSLQSCPTLCDPIDGSPPGSPIPRILQARTVEWVAISLSHA